MTQKIEVREVDDFADEPAKCPFCGTTALEFDEEGTSYELKPCPHLLFFCYDDGWDYLSDRAAKNLSELGYRVRTEDVIEVDTERTRQDQEQIEDIQAGLGPLDTLDHVVLEKDRNDWVPWL